MLFSYSDCLHVLTLIAYSISQKTSYCKDPPKLSTYTCSLNMWKSISALTVSTTVLRPSRWAPYSPQAQDPHNEHQTVLRPKTLTMDTRQSSAQDSHDEHHTVLCPKTLTMSTRQSSGPRPSQWALDSPPAQDPHNEHQTVLRPKILTMSTRQSSGPRPSWWAPVLRPKTNFVRTSKFLSFFLRTIKIFKDSFGPVNSNFHFEDCNISMGNIEPTQDIYY